MMKNYVERNLAKDENIVGEMKISWLTLVGPIIFLTLMSFVAFILLKNGTGLWAIVLPIFGLIPLICVIARNRATHLVVTDKRVLGKVGVFKMKTWDFPIDKIDNIAQSASFFGRIFGYATLELYGSSGKGIVALGVGNANQFKNTLTEAIDLRAEEERKMLAAEIAAAMGK